MKYLLGKFASLNWMVFMSLVSTPFQSISNTACILNWYSKKNDDYILVIHYSPFDVLRHLCHNRAAKALPITLFGKSSCKFVAALSSLSMICKEFFSLALLLLSHTLYQFFSKIWTIRWEDFVTFVCEWVDSLDYFWQPRTRTVGILIAHSSNRSCNWALSFLDLSKVFVN